jgi:flagellar hook-associated protein 1 FlgK
VVWKGTSVGLTNLNGQLRGLLESRDELIPDYIEQLNELTAVIVREVNALHRTGYGLDGTTDTDFFDPNMTDAATIRINPQVEANVNRIVASSSDAGDNLIALAISDLRHAAVTADNTMSMNEFYSSLVGTLGVQTQEATSLTENYELLVNQIDNSRQSVQGVSLDEEMANLVKSQHAYDAAARVITAMDQALDTVIAGMGIVGR